MLPDAMRAAMSPLERFLELLAAADCAPRVRDGVAGRGTARCPVHDDHRPSLTFGVGDRVPIVASCRACGADLPAILAAVGASPEDQTLILKRTSASVARCKPRTLVSSPVHDYPPADEVDSRERQQARRENREPDPDRPPVFGGEHAARPTPVRAHEAALRGGRCST